MTMQERLFEAAGVDPFTVHAMALKLGLTETQIRGCIDRSREEYKRLKTDLTVERIDENTFQFVLEG